MHEIAMQVNKEDDGRNKIAFPIAQNFTRMKSSMLESTLRKFIVAILALYEIEAEGQLEITGNNNC